MDYRRLASWALRLFVAVILLQTLFFKFTGAEESVFIFSELGVEPWGRFASGMLELVASVLILLPATVAYGAFLAAFLMVGAVASHLFKLGIVVQGDGGLLFLLAMLVLFASAALLWLHRKDLPL